MNKKELETQIHALFKLWVAEKGKEQIDKVRYSGPVLGETEYEGILNAIFTDWWSGGKYTLEAEQKLAKLSDRNFGLLTNSGSSANLVLMSAARELYFEDGDKILTLSCGFPTTVNPIITNRLIPLFADISLDDLSLDPELFEEIVKKDTKVKGVFIAHTLGYKGQIDEILDIALVCYEVPDGSETDLYCNEINLSNSVVSSQIVISGHDYNQNNPFVFWSGHSFMIAWEVMQRF